MSVIIPTNTTDSGSSCNIGSQQSSGSHSHLFQDVDIEVQLREGDLAREVPGGLSEDVAGEDGDEALVPRHEQGRLTQGAGQQGLVDKHCNTSVTQATAGGSRPRVIETNQ